MTRSQFDALMADASQTVRQNGRKAIGESYDNPPRNSASHPEPQPPVCDVPLAAAQTQSGNPGIIHVRIESRRKRLLDADNLIGKFHLDLCRYSRLIPNDRPEDISYSITQTKIKAPEKEVTIIEITYP